MKTKNVKVRVNDIKAGRVIYVAHPVYGICTYLIKSRPKLGQYVKSLFVDVQMIFDGKTYNTRTDSISLRDSGVIGGNSYNGRRTFFKLKQAEAWMKKWADSPWFIESHEEHERSNRELDLLGSYYDYDY